MQASVTEFGGHEMSEVTITVSAASLSAPAEELYVCGDAPALGAWDLTNALPLATSRETRPVWRNPRPVYVSAEHGREYKYAVFAEGEFQRWETVEHNRTIEMGSGPPLAVHDALDTLEPPPPPLPAPTAAAVPSASEQAAMLLGLPDDTPVKIEEGDSLILVSALLPVRVSRVESDKPAGLQSEFVIEWDHEHLLGGKQDMQSLRVLWVGCIDLPNVDEMEEAILTDMLAGYNCVPVFCKKDVREGHRAYCRNTLIPRLHSIINVFGEMPTQWWDKERHNFDWQMFNRLNREFAKKVQELYQTGDLVWIHDYQLMLMPSYLLSHLPQACLGLFHHQPFPSSEIFRTVSVREELLRGMLNVDVLGFHNFEYARHFLICCTRLLGLRYKVARGGNLTVEYNGRSISIVVSHVSIDLDNVSELLATEAVQQRVTELKAKFAGKTVMVAVDNLTRLSGITLKLLAFENLLEETPTWKGRLRLVQFVVEDFFEKGDDFEKVCAETSELVSRINAKFGDVVIYKRYARLSREERLPYFAVSSVYVNSCVRQGLNTKPFEFIYCASQSGSPGLSVLSEFLGSGRILSGALRCNPYDVARMTKLMDVALSMGKSEKVARQSKDLKYVQSNTTAAWALSFLLEMKRVARHDDKQYAYVGFGLGLRFRVMRIKADFKRLDTDMVQRAYRKSSKRLILLDYGGTMVGDTATGRSEGQHVAFMETGLPSSHLATVQQLCKDSRNTVMVVSGRGREELIAAFQGVTNVGLAAEHGYYTHYPNESELSTDSAEWEIGEKWTKHGLEHDDAWRVITSRVMRDYQSRTQGSVTEVKHSAVTWVWRDADPEFGHMQANELRTHLEGVLVRQGGYPVVIVQGAAYLEVRLRGINKGELLERVFHSLANKAECPDFCLCIGNDDHDEYMFAQLHSLEGKELPSGGMYDCMAGPMSLPTGFHGYSCTVGRKASNARYYLDDIDDVWSVLECLKATTQKMRQFRSSGDLSSMQDAGSDALAAGSGMRRSGGGMGARSTGGGSFSAGLNNLG